MNRGGELALSGNLITSFYKYYTSKGANELLC